MTTALADLRKQLDGYKSELEGLGEKLNGLRAKGEARSDNERTEMLSTIDDITALDVMYRMAQRQAEDSLIESTGPKGTRAGVTETRGVGQQFVEDEGYRNWIANGQSGTYQAEVRTLVDSTGNFSASFGSATAGPGLFAPIGQPFLPPATLFRQRLFIEDVLASLDTTLANIPYIQELNSAAHFSAASGAQFVAEGTQKPEIGMEWTPKDAPIRKVAAWVPVTNEILADAPLVAGLIRERLSFSVKLATERALLNGNGTAPNIAGLLNAGISTQGNVPAGDPFAALGRALGQVEVAQGDPSFIAMHPTDYWTMQTTRYSSNFAGTGGSTQNPAPFGTPPSDIWGLPVVRTIGMSAGTALVGCRDGAVVLNREAFTVKVGDQHLDYFTTNKVAILGERRVGLMTLRPDWFVSTTIAFS